MHPTVAICLTLMYKKNKGIAHMNLLAINGSPRKGKSTETLIDKAIEGVKFKSPNCKVKKIHLIEHDIRMIR